MDFEFFDGESKTISQRDMNCLDTKWIPPHNFILFREEETAMLINFLKKTLNRNFEFVTIFGTGGVGKTAIVCSVLNKLSEDAKRRDVRFRYVYTNAFNKRSEFKIISHITSGLGMVYTGQHIHKYYELLENFIFSNNIIPVVVIDEIDKLKKQDIDDVLYNLYEVSSNLCNKNRSGISVVLITNSLQFQEDLDERVKSRIPPKTVCFNTYTALELKKILEKRVEGMGVNQAVINKCAALAAQERGDARTAIELLRDACELSGGLEKADERSVDEVMDKIYIREYKNVINKLSIQARVAFLALLQTEVQNETMLIKNIFSNYKKLCRERGMKEIGYRRFGQILSETNKIGNVFESVRISDGRHGVNTKITLFLDYSQASSLYDDIIKL